MPQLPATDLNVFPICLGSVPLGSTLDQAASFRQLDEYLAAGGNFIDTAQVYANWLPGERSISEKTIGVWLSARKNRQRVIIATKGAHPDLASMSVPRMSPAEVIGDLDNSLRHLGLDTIDLYWLHRDDPTRPVGEVLETLEAQRQAGKIRYYACSNWPTGRIRAAQLYAREHALPGFVASQVLWSLAAVDPNGLADKTLAFMDDEMHAFHQESGLAAIPYTSQAGGFFSKAATGQIPLDAPGPYNTPRNRRRLARIQQLKTETGLSITQIVLGYLISQPFTTVPIIGPKTPAQLQDCLSAAQTRLTAQQLSFLEA